MIENTAKWNVASKFVFRAIAVGLFVTTLVFAGLGGKLTVDERGVDVDVKTSLAKGKGGGGGHGGGQDHGKGHSSDNDVASNSKGHGKAHGHGHSKGRATRTVSNDADDEVGTKWKNNLKSLNSLHAINASPGAKERAAPNSAVAAARDYADALSQLDQDDLTEEEREEQIQLAAEALASRVRNVDVDPDIVSEAAGVVGEDVDEATAKAVSDAVNAILD